MAAPYLLVPLQSICMGAERRRRRFARLFKKTVNQRRGKGEELSAKGLFGTDSGCCNDAQALRSISRATLRRRCKPLPALALMR